MFGLSCRSGPIFKQSRTMPLNDVWASAGGLYGHGFHVSGIAGFLGERWAAPFASDLRYTFHVSQ